MGGQFLPPHIQNSVNGDLFHKKIFEVTLDVNKTFLVLFWCLNVSSFFLLFATFEHMKLFISNRQYYFCSVRPLHHFDTIFGPGGEIIGTIFLRYFCLIGKVLT